MKALILLFIVWAIPNSQAQKNAPAPPATQQPQATAASENSAIAAQLEKIAQAQQAKIAIQQAEKEAQKNDNHATRDLAAQEAMAGWAKWSFITVLIGTILSAGGLIALLRSLSLTRRATDASQSAVVVAKETVTVARETNEAQIRPWRSISCALDKPYRQVGHIGIEAVVFNVHCHTTNHGRSPATNVSFRAKMALLSRNSRSAYEMMIDFCDAERSGQIDLPAEAVFPDAKGEFSHHVSLSTPDIEAHKDNFAPVLFGCLNYRSPNTNRIHQSRFFYHIVTIHPKGYTAVIDPSNADWINQPIRIAVPGTIACD